MYMMTILLPFLTSLIVLIYGKFMGNKGVSLLTVCSMFLSLLSSFFIFYEVIINNCVCNMSLYKWTDFGYFNIYVSFFFDTLTCVMLLVVCTISLFVHMYSIDYMLHDPNFNSFMSYLSLFTFFMLLLVSADNYLLMFIGWEGVGLSSYLLINFWYLSILANKAAMKAMLVNSVGDLMLLMGMSLLFFSFNSLKYSVVFSLVLYYLHSNFIFFGISVNLMTIISIFIFLGAMGKSAQLGLHMWLPDAMEGPTPVSALIHAATMVTAGVFLVISSSFLFENSYNILIFVSFIGGLTCLFSGLIGVLQFDMKKMVAYSTCSQLGYMFFSCGMSNYNVGLFHLFNHAFFKALLFLSMGSMMHALSDEQDISRMGGLMSYLPMTYILVFMGSLSLLAMPFLTGFYSKDLLLEFVFSMYSMNSLFIYFLGVIAAFFTAFYSFRLIYWVFFAKANFYKSYFVTMSELNFFMLITMMMLGLCSIIVGYLFYDAFLGIGSLFWGNSIYVSLLNYTVLDAEFSLFVVKYVPLFFSLLGIFSFFLLNKYYFYYSYFLLLSNSFVYNVYFFFNKAMFFDYFFNNLFMNNVLSYSYSYIYKYMEKGIFEVYGPIFVFSMIVYFSNTLNKLNNGLIYHYIFFILWMMLALIIFFEFMAWLDFDYLLFSVICLFGIYSVQNMILMYTEE